MIENNFGELISKLRKESNLTQKDLANKLNISDKAISRWETGKNYPTLEMIYEMSKLFGVPFNDLMTVRMTCDSKDNDVVENIIKAFSEKDKRKVKRIKRFLFITIAIIVVLVAVLIFTNTYNRFKVYKVKIENSDFKTTSGVFIETNMKDTLNIGSLKIRNKDLTEYDSVSVDLYFLEDGEEKIIHSFNGTSNIYFTNFQSYVKIDDLMDYIDNLYIKVTLVDSDNNVEYYSGKLIFTLDFSNNVIYNKDNNDITNNINITKLSQEEIIKILMDNGYEKMSNWFYVKNIKNSKILYYVDSNKIEYSFTKNNFNYKYSYYLNNGQLEIYVYNEKNIEIENYIYDANNDKIINCITGKCNNYKEVMDIMNANVLNIFKKL